jgi:acetoacetyl-CoA synthetase
MGPLWRPSQEAIEHTNLWQFLKKLNARYNTDFTSYEQLYDWSIQHIPEFWNFLWDFSGLISTKKGEKVLVPSFLMEKSQFFPQARLNYAENILKDSSTRPSITFWGEDKVKRTLTFDALKEQVAAIQEALEAWGIKKGDRVVGFMPNIPETIVAMLATVSLGAIWSSCSPDFGLQGIIDRFGQIMPKVLFSADGYYYAGHWYSSVEKIRQVKPHLSSLLKTVIVPYDGRDLKEELNSQEISYNTLTQKKTSKPLIYKQVPFNHPLFIMYSSGTTGVPKCIVHGHGGTLIQHLKEHQLHCDIRPGDRVFYFTTCGWMMWNWLVSALASQAHLMLFDGSPFYPEAGFLFKYAEAERFTLFGTSAKYIDSLHKQGIKPRDNYELSSLRLITSTGSPLSPESFDYVYEAVSPDICLSSISGGTDIISCFALGNPIGPVWRGELQARGLGLKVEVFDEQGHSLQQQKGELVCTAPFPSMPVGFWNDPTGERYHDTYFSRFPNIWYHGDYVELTEHQGLIIYGRSDSTLNPGGVRIGTAEIYRQVQHIQEILECIAIGQEYQGDIRIILFVHLREGLVLTSSLIDKIKRQIRGNTTPRHVPSLILQIQDIPRTLNGKLAERAVTEVIHGRTVKNKEALANPMALKLYEILEELKS